MTAFFAGVLSGAIARGRRLEVAAYHAGRASAQRDMMLRQGFLKVRA